MAPTGTTSQATCSSACIGYRPSWRLRRTFGRAMSDALRPEGLVRECACGSNNFERVVVHRSRGPASLRAPSAGSCITARRRVISQRRAAWRILGKPARDDRVCDGTMCNSGSSGESEWGRPAAMLCLGNEKTDGIAPGGPLLGVDTWATGQATREYWRATTCQHAIRSHECLWPPTVLAV